MELSGLEVNPLLLELQVYVVEARYDEGTFPLPADRSEILEAVKQLLTQCESRAQS